MTSHADVDAWLEDDALGLHLLDPAVDPPLLHLEVGDAVAEQAADAVGPLEDDDIVTDAGELLRGGQPGGAGADDRHPLARLDGGDLRHDPALGPGAIDDRQLDLLDRDRVVVDPQHARGLAGGRAERAGELGEVVRGVQAVDGRLPVVAVDQVVPVGDQVPERAALVAERDAAVHAAGALLAELDDRQGREHLPVVVEAFVDRPVAARPARRSSRNPVGLPTAHLQGHVGVGIPIAAPRHACVQAGRAGCRSG